MKKELQILVGIIGVSASIFLLFCVKTDTAVFEDIRFNKLLWLVLVVIEMIIGCVGLAYFIVGLVDSEPILQARGHMVRVFLQSNVENNKFSLYKDLVLPTEPLKGKKFNFGDYTFTISEEPTISLKQPQGFYVAAILDGDKAIVGMEEALVKDEWKPVGRY